MSDRFKFTKATRPEPNRLIRVQGHDWSPFTAYGMWVPYKSPPNKKGTGRFMRRTRDGRFEADRATWLDTETWEYAEEIRP